MHALEAISPVDGRYREKTSGLAAIFCEQGLMRYRILVEGEYLIALSQTPGVGLRGFSEEGLSFIRGLSDLSLEDAQVIRDIERKGWKDLKATNHDVKAVEYFLRDRFAGTSLRDVQEWIHFGLTSWDVNNIAYALMLSEALEKEIVPAVRGIEKHLNELALAHKALPMLARTHGQPATPTTFGKEFKVFAARLAKQLEGLGEINIQAKLNGASGNWNAHAAACPDVDWMGFSTRFIEGFNENRDFKLAANLVTTQIEPYDSYAEVFDALRRINMILVDFSQDMWRYISDGWIVQKPKEGEVGSSTMPHKVNPIHFENAEGNLGLANAMLEFFSRKLPISRLQRDLSDSTVLRNFGVALAHCSIGYANLREGLNRVRVDEAEVRSALRRHPEVIAEAIQTVLRREGAPLPYEQLKALTRGAEVTMESLGKFIDALEVAPEVKARLARITPENYIGLAEEIAGS